MWRPRVYKCRPESNTITGRPAASFSAGPSPPFPSATSATPGRVPFPTRMVPLGNVLVNKKNETNKKKTLKQNIPNHWLELQISENSIVDYE